MSKKKSTFAAQNRNRMKYGVIGVGAIGGYYGCKLAHSGQEVHFLLHRDL